MQGLGSLPRCNRGLQLHQLAYLLLQEVEGIGAIAYIAKLRH